jgi:NAD(P)H-flavin reductase
LDLIAENRDKFGKIFLLYGAKNPEEILLKDKMEEWGKNDIKVITTIDKPAPGWKGNVGFVPDLVKETEINPANAAVVMCGPKPMTDAMEKILGPLGIPDRRIFASLERRMQCGVGKCQHCTTGSKYVCADGPVFNYDEIDKNYD